MRKLSLVCRKFSDYQVGGMGLEPTEKYGRTDLWEGWSGCLTYRREQDALIEKRQVIMKSVPERSRWITQYIKRNERRK